MKQEPASARTTRADGTPAVHGREEVRIGTRTRRPTLYASSGASTARAMMSSRVLGCDIGGVYHLCRLCVAAASPRAIWQQAVAQIFRVMFEPQRRFG